MTQKPYHPTTRLVGLKGQQLPSDANNRYLYQPGELKGGGAVELIQCGLLKCTGLGRQGEPVLYHLQDGPVSGFAWEELLAVPHDTVLSPDGVLKCCSSGVLQPVDQELSLGRIPRGGRCYMPHSGFPGSLSRPQLQTEARFGGRFADVGAVWAWSLWLTFLRRGPDLVIGRVTLRCTRYITTAGGCQGQ